MKLNEMCGAEPGRHPAGQNVGSRVTAGINPGVGRCALPAGGDVWMQTTAGGITLTLVLLRTFLNYSQVIHNTALAVSFISIGCRSKILLQHIC